jgi:uncharacterized RDD family membrane protein YckC
VHKPERVFDPEALAIAPSLTGRALPSPRRRLAAFAVDYVLLLAPTVAAAFLFSGLALRMTDPAGFRAVRQAVLGRPADPAAQRAMMRDLTPVLARTDAVGLPAAVKADVEAGDIEKAADRLQSARILVALDLGGGTPAPPPAGTVRLDIERLIPLGLRNAAIFLVPALYFAVATSRWGTTLGKRLFAMQVLRLDGRPLSLLQGIERFGAYFAVAGTLGLGLLDLWRNPNRRLAHDLAAETVVVRRVKGDRPRPSNATART